jgi:hypothetical protein
MAGVRLYTVDPFDVVQAQPSTRPGEARHRHRGQTFAQRHASPESGKYCAYGFPVEIYAQSSHSPVPETTPSCT